MKDNNIYLKNIIDKAREAFEFCDEMLEKDFLNDAKTQSAVIMKLIVIGEEAKKLPEEITSKIDLPWKTIVGFRNMAVHEYFDIDLSQVWDTIQMDIPDLINKIENYLK